MIERRIDESGIPRTHLWPNAFMQNFRRFAPLIRERGAFYAPLGDARVSLVEIEDVAAVTVAALVEDGHEGETYEITGPEAISYAECAAILSNELGREVRYVSVSDDEARAALAKAGIGPEAAHALVENAGLFRWDCESTMAARRYSRDMVGYGRNRPHPRWPGDARIAVQFVINYEEGAENSILHGDAGSETLLTEFGFVEPRVGERALPVESMYKFGSRVGFWRLRRLFTERAVPVTVFGVRAQSRGGGGDGRGGVGDREPRLPLDRLPRGARGRGAQPHREGDRGSGQAHRQPPSRLLPRPPQPQHGAPGGGEGWLPLPPGFLRR